MDVLIQPLVEADIDTVVELISADLRQLGHSPTHDGLSRLFQRVLAEAQKTSPASLCWVARDTPETPPFGLILVNIHISVEFEGDGLWIEELYVDPSQRRRGIGRKLVDHLLDWAEEHGFQGIDLEAYHGNTPAAVLYRSLGFHRLGRERFYFRFDD